MSQLIVEVFMLCLPQVIINCVCAPDQSHAVGAFHISPIRPFTHQQQQQQPPSPHNRVLARMWQVVQNNNGIKVRATDAKDLMYSFSTTLICALNSFVVNLLCFVLLDLSEYCSV